MSYEELQKEQKIKKYKLTTPYICLATLIFMVVILFCRKPDAFLNPQFWAEDGPIFFMGYIEYGFKSIITPYGGYLHLVPRLIAGVASLVPFSMTPTIYNYSALAVMLLVGGSFFSSRYNLPFNPLLALSMVLVPHYGEVFMTITHIPSYLCFMLLMLFFKEPPIKFIHYILDYSIIILCGLTGPFVFMLLPLFIVKCFIRKSPHNYGMCFAVLLCASIQGWCFFSAFNVFGMGGKEICSNINTWATLLGHKLFSQIFLREDISDKINPVILAIFAMIMPIVLILFASSKRQLLLIGAFLFFGIAVALSTLYMFSTHLEEITYSVVNGDRYFYMPYVMVMWSLIVGLNSLNLIKRVIASILLLLILISSSQHFRSTPYVDYHWKEYCGKIENGIPVPVLVPINPPGWFLDFRLK
jgi:hypothetical protein